MQEIDPIKAQEHLDSLDKKSGVNSTATLNKSKKQPAELISQPNQLGWKNLPLENLPSKGRFYVDSFTIAIKSATVAEIRHWSTIDETDMISVDDQLNYILERCAEVRINNEVVSWKEILEIDRFFIIFKIQELTFPNGENQLPQKFECLCTTPKYSEKLTIESSTIVNSKIEDISNMPQEDIDKVLSNSKRLSDIATETSIIKDDNGLSLEQKQLMLDDMKKEVSEFLETLFYSIDVYEQVCDSTTCPTDGYYNGNNIYRGVNITSTNYEYKDGSNGKLIFYTIDLERSYEKNIQKY
jgi:hypothetical protein